MELLRTGAKELGLTLSDETLSKFAVYYESVLEYNEKVNLTAITEEDDFIVKHFLDSLTAHSLLPMGANVVDIGSGAGFPAIPLKLVRDDLSLTLLDALKKRVTFLEEIIEKLGLSSCSAVHLRAEEAALGAYRARFDVAVVRAVAELRTLVEYALPLLKVGGIFIAYKGGGCCEASGCAHALKELHGEIVEERGFKLPISGDGRQLIVIRKNAATPDKYPRGGAKPKNYPL